MAELPISAATVDKRTLLPINFVLGEMISKSQNCLPSDKQPELAAEVPRLTMVNLSDLIFYFVWLFVLLVLKT